MAIIKRLVCIAALMALLVSCTAARPLQSQGDHTVPIPCVKACPCPCATAESVLVEDPRSRMRVAALLASYSDRDTPDCQSALSLIKAEADLSIFTKAVIATGIDELLDDPNAVFTLFAPDDDAFAELLTRLRMTEEELLSKPFLLTRVLDYHIVGGQVIEEADLEDGVQLDTEARWPPIIGKRMRVTVRRGADNSIVLDGNGSNARVTETDLQACAAVVHRIDTVLLPDKLPVVATE